MNTFCCCEVGRAANNEQTFSLRQSTNIIHNEVRDEGSGYQLVIHYYTSLISSDNSQSLLDQSRTPIYHYGNTIIKPLPHNNQFTPSLILKLLMYL